MCSSGAKRHAEFFPGRAVGEHLWGGLGAWPLAGAGINGHHV